MPYNNLAYEYDNLARIEEEDNKIREEKRRAAAKLRLKSRRRMNFFLICAILALSVSAYFMISKNVQLHETNSEISRLEKELSGLESTTSQKIFELEQSVDLDAVEEIATTRLNMQRPEKYQIVYVDVPMEDVTEVTANDVEGVENQIANIAKKMKDNIFGIFDFGM